MATLASPLAFELCDGTCGEPKPSKDNKHVSCPPSDKCATGGCYCQLFKRKKKDATDDTPWEVAHADHEGKTKYRPEELEYKCFCVKPILEAGEVTVDEVKYKIAYRLCGQGSCDLTNIPVFGGGDKKHQEIKCTGKCDGECKCTMFRLQVSVEAPATFEPKNAKWELAAKADKQIKFDGHYVYRCFCLK